MVGGRKRRNSVRLAGVLATVGLLYSMTVMSGSTAAADELIGTATFTGEYVIPEQPNHPEFPTLGYIPLNIPPAGVPNAQAVDVEVTVEIEHGNQGEIDLYLSRPVGWHEMIRLMSDVGEGEEIDARLTFDDHTPDRVGAAPADGGRYRPSNEGDDEDDADTLEAFDITESLGFLPSSDPAHQELWGAANEFNGFGDWRLYVVDDTPNGVTGTITHAEIRVTYGATNDDGSVPGDHPIIIPAPGTSEGPADVYPSEIEFVDSPTVGFYDNLHSTGLVRGLTVQLDGYRHSSTSDLNIALQGPGGQVAILMTHNPSPTQGGDSVNLQLVHGGPPMDAPLVSGTYRPTQGVLGLTQPLEQLFPGSGLTGLQTGGLEQFVGTDPEGVWRLWVYQDAFDTNGRIERWSIALDLNERPDAVNDSVAGTEDGGAITGNVLSNDSDPDGDPLTASVVEEPEHGELTLDDDGSFSYVPNADFHGTDTFRYSASDGDLEDTATVTIDISAVNDPPVAASESYDAVEDTPLVVDAAEGVLANDTDVDGDDLFALVEEEPAHGTIALGSDGGFTYTPDPDFNGLDSFTYVASDVDPDDMGLTAAAVSEATTVEIRVAAVNDAPVAVDDTASVAPTVTTTTTESPAVDAEDRLPRTGSDTGTILLLSAVLAAAGTLANAASAATRRR